MISVSIIFIVNSIFSIVFHPVTTTTICFDENKNRYIAMAENALKNLFDSVSEYIYDFIETLRPRQHDENFYVLSMGQLTIPIMLIACIYGIAIWIFLGEILLFNWRTHYRGEFIIHIFNFVLFCLVLHSKCFHVVLHIISSIFV